MAFQLWPLDSCEILLLHNENCQLFYRLRFLENLKRIDRKRNILKFISSSCGKSDTKKKFIPSVNMTLDMFCMGVQKLA